MDAAEVIERACAEHPELRLRPPPPRDEVDALETDLGVPLPGDLRVVLERTGGIDGGPLVSYDTPTPLECDQVIFDREDNAYRAARHLLEMGHRRIGLAVSRSSGLPTGSESDPQTHRLRGFQRALQEFDVPLREEWLFRNAPYEWQKIRSGLENAFIHLMEGSKDNFAS